MCEGLRCARAKVKKRVCGLVVPNGSVSNRSVWVVPYYGGRAVVEDRSEVVLDDLFIL